MAPAFRGPDDLTLFQQDRARAVTMHANHMRVWGGGGGVGRGGPLC